MDSDDSSDDEEFVFQTNPNSVSYDSYLLADQISKANIPLQRTRTADIAEPDQSKRSDIKPPIRIKTSHLNPGQLLRIRDIRTEIDSAWSLRSQVKIVVDALRLTPRGAVATWDEIGEMFYLTRGAVADLYKKGVPYKMPGRPSLLTFSQEDELVCFIAKRYNQAKPPTYYDLVDFVEKRWDISILIDTMRKIISRLPELKVVDGEPMESDRVSCPCEAIDKHFNLLEKDFEFYRIPAHFVINLDEAGFCEWADATTISVVVPVEHPDSKVKFPVDRTAKRSTLLAAIAADGTALKPCVIIKRKNVEHELLIKGYTSDKVMIEHQENGFITMSIFEDWAEKVLFPYIEEKRKKLNYQGWAMVIVDGCSAHDSDWFLEECLYHRIKVHFLPPHSSDQTQPLDIGVFGIQKTRIKQLHLSDDLNQQTQQVIKIIDSLHSVSTISNITSAFRGAGIVLDYDEKTGLNYCRVDRNEAVKVRHWVNVQSAEANAKRVKLDKLKLLVDVLNT